MTLLTQRRLRFTAFIPVAFAIALTLPSVLANDTEEEDVKITEVTYGSTVKLIHVPTGYRLHSHEIKYGSGSGQQSVTNYHSSGDSNSYWLVRGAYGVARQPSPGTVVSCGDTLRLMHLATKRNLHSHLHQAPLNRDYEVSAYAVGDSRMPDGDSGDNWRLECGRGKTTWGRADEIRLQHIDTHYYLSSDKSLTFPEPIANQLQVGATKRRKANSVWKTNEGFFLAVKK